MNRVSEGDVGKFMARGIACRRSGRILFSGLDLSLAPGEALLVTGRNGVGKSSLLRLLAGLSKPESGYIIFECGDGAQDPEVWRGNVAWLSHLNALKPGLTVRENISFWARLRGGEVGDALQRSGIEMLAETPVRLLSAGQRRRTALARIWASGALLWLLDEPAAGLDAASRRLLDNMIADHRNNGGMVIAVTHGELDIPASHHCSLDEFAP